MKPNRLIFLGADIDFGRTTLTERIHEMAEERGITIEPHNVLVYNPNAEADRAAVAKIMAEKNSSDLVVICDDQKDKLSLMDELDKIMQATAIKCPSILTIKPCMDDISKHIKPEALRKKSGFERANPNQPFYTKFKRPAKNWHK